MPLKKVFLGASALVLAATAVTLSSPAADATGCNNGHACYYSATNKSGSSFGDSCGIDNFAIYDFNGTSTTLNDHVASAKGASYATTELWQNAHRTGTSYVISVGGTANNFGGFGTSASSSTFLFPEGGGCPSS